jgi:hypothetical protein
MHTHLPLRVASSIVFEVGNAGFALAELPSGWVAADWYPGTLEMFQEKDEALREQERRFGARATT